MATPYPAKKDRCAAGQATTQMRRKGAQYKLHYDKKIRFEPKVVPSQLVYVHEPLLSSGRNNADRTATACYNKLQPRSSGTFRVINV